MDTIEKEFFYVSSSETEFDYKLQIDHDAHYQYISVVNAGIPKTFYMINTQATLDITTDQNTFSCTVAPGNYSSSELTTILQADFTLYEPTGYTFTVTGPFDSNTTGYTTGKYSIDLVLSSTPTDYTGDANPTMTTTSSELARLLGITADTTVSFTGTGASRSFLSTKQVNFQRYASLMILGNIVDRNQLQVIHCANNPYNSSISYQAQDLFLHSKSIRVNNTNVYHFKLVNAETLDEIIDLNGSTFGFELCVWKMKKPSDVMVQYFAHLYKESLALPQKLASLTLNAKVPVPAKLPSSSSVVQTPQRKKLKLDQNRQNLLS